MTSPIETVRVTELYQDTGNRAVWGTVRFTPVAERLTAAEQAILLPLTVEVKVRDGEFTADLVPNDAPGLLPTGWAYLVQEEFGGKRMDPYTIEVTSDMGPDVRLSSLAPLGTPSGPAPISYVRRINGQTGDITINKTTLGIANVDNTSDANKPLSTAAALALAGKVVKGELMVNVKDAPFGALGNNTGNDAPAIQAAIDSLPTSGTFVGGNVFLPPGTYRITTPIILKSNVRLSGAGRKASRIHANSGGLFTWTADLNNVVIEHLYLSGISGHLFTPSAGDWGWHTSSVDDCVIVQQDPNSSIVRHVSANDYDNVSFTNCDLTRIAGSTVPGFNIVNSAGAANQNRWEDCWAHSQNANAAPFFHIESTSNVNYAYDNVFRNITGEQNAGGLIRALSTYNLVVDNCTDYDATVPYTASIVHVGKSGAAGGIPSVYPTIRSSGRRDNATLPVGIFDVNLVPNEVQRALVQSPNHSSSKLKLNFGATNIATILNAYAGSWTGQPIDALHYYSHPAQFAQGLYVGPSKVQSGTGTPEGVIVGNVGDEFIRTDGAAGTVKYLKTSGTGNTGWDVVPSGRLVVEEAPITPMRYGAIGNGTTDDTAAFSAMWAALPSVGGHVYLPPNRNFLVTQTLPIHTSLRIQGADRRRSLITNRVSDVFTISASITDVHMSNFGVIAGSVGTVSGGHILEIAGATSFVGPALSRFENLYWQQNRADRAVVHMLDGQWLDNQFTHCHTYGYNRTVPAIHLRSTTGSLGDNLFADLRHTDDGTPTTWALWLEEFGSTTALGNTMQRFNFENPAGGAVLLRGQNSALLRHVWLWDLHTAATNHLIRLDRTVGGQPNVMTTLEYISRPGGAGLGSGLRDISSSPGNALGTTVRRCGTDGSQPMIIDLAHDVGQSIEDCYGSGVSIQSYLPTAALGAGAGTGAALTSRVGGYYWGNITLTSGTGTASGPVVTVGWPNGLRSAPWAVLVSPRSASAAAAGLYVTSVSSTGFTVAAANALPVSTAGIVFDYLVQRNITG